jgi:hypothetical protein
MEAPRNVTDTPDTPSAPPTSRKSSLMRSVNNKMRHGSEALASFDSIPFFCECESSSCHSSIWISLADFDTVVADARAWLLVQGHESSASPPGHRGDSLAAREMESSPQTGVPADLEASQAAGVPWRAVFHRGLARNTRAADATAGP